MIDMPGEQRRKTLTEMSAEAQEAAIDAGMGVGLACPKCGCRDTRVKYTRHSATGSQTRRRRECRNCGELLTSFERVV